MTTIAKVLLFMCLVARDGNFDAAGAFKRRSRYEHHDFLFLTRCEASCWHRKNDRSSCIKTCLLKGFNKPGSCPKDNTTLSPFAAVCMTICRNDSECPGLEKCCRHNCGMSCQYPEDLFSVLEVPNIPREVRVSEGNRKRTIFITWINDISQKNVSNSTILYVIEERHHLGRNFIEERLTQWTPCGRSIKTKSTLKNFVKPGRWYQFRVAAVNQNGTKGFSDNSPTFGISESPKPPKAPTNVTVGPFWSVNGTLYAEARWLPPPSDLPIQKYKVFWSRRLYGVNALESALVHQRVVSKETTKFLLQDLQPNSAYFLQVQALVQFGKSRLKGEKCGYPFNTTSYDNVTSNSHSKANTTIKMKVENLHLQKLYWYQGNLYARIIWKVKDEAARYTVSWRTGLCIKKNTSFDQFKLVATTNESYFDIHELQFSCQYRVSVREVSSSNDIKSIQDTFITFMTPSCDEFKENHRKIQCS